MTKIKPKYDYSRITVTFNKSDVEQSKLFNEIKRRSNLLNIDDSAFIRMILNDHVKQNEFTINFDPAVPVPFTAG